MTDTKMPDRITAWPWEVNPHMGQWETAQSIVGEGQPYLALHGETLAEVRAAAIECADDLAAEIDAKYGIGTAPPEAFHPVTIRQHCRDMEPVMRLRAALAKLGG